MKLSKPIVIKPSAYSDQSGKIIQPETIILDELILTLTDIPRSKTVTASIANIPHIFTLFQNEEYDQIGDWTQKQAEDKLLSLLGDDPSAYIQSLLPKTLENHPNGAGTILSQMIKSLGIVVTNNCSCKRHAIEMNENGNDWCEQNIDTIVGWLRVEANKRRIPFIDALGKLVVNRAIKKSRRLLNNLSVPNDDNELDNL